MFARKLVYFVKIPNSQKANQSNFSLISTPQNLILPRLNVISPQLSKIKTEKTKIIIPYSMILDREREEEGDTWE